MSSEFQEISHSGGRSILSIRETDGRRQVSLSFESRRPVPCNLVGIYANQLGEAVQTASLGSGGHDDQPPNTIIVHLASDSEGHFGHRCPSCAGKWRSDFFPRLCPYCAKPGDGHEFLSDAQRRFIALYCQEFFDALDTPTTGDVIIDMDAIGDAAMAEGSPHPFAEESQQLRYECKSCGNFNDIIGRYGYCCICGTRRDLDGFKSDIEDARSALKAGTVPADLLVKIVGAFDSLVAQYVKQLLARVPLSQARRKRFSNSRYHDFARTSKLLLDVFDVDLTKGMTAEDISFTSLRFFRRHVYEHNGGEVDQRYLDQSGDSSVRLKQHIREDMQDVHRLFSCCNRAAENLHAGFHEMFPPLSGPIDYHKSKLMQSEKR